MKTLPGFFRTPTGPVVRIPINSEPPTQHVVDMRNIHDEIMEDQGEASYEDLFVALMNTTEFVTNH